MEAVCQGCGAPLQSTAPDAPGYVPQSAKDREHPVCRRCYRITHYGDFSHVSVAPSEYQKTVTNALFDTDTVLYVIDVFDVEGSLVPNLAQLIGDQRVVIALNKVDVLPLDVHPKALSRRVRKIVEESGVRVAAVVSVSGMSGLGLEELMNVLYSEGRDETVCVLGMANVGKSTLLNQLTSTGAAKPLFTTSRMPGTTLGLTTVVVTDQAHRSHVLVDTPGLMTGQRATDHLCPDCLHRAVPSHRLRPRVFQLDGGQSLFLGGFARFDFGEGVHQPIVCYVSNDLVVHRTKLVRAESLYRDHADDILVTPCKACRPALSDWTQYRVTTRSAIGEQTLHCGANGCDIVLAGLGWITLFGKPLEGVLHVPANLQVTTRPRFVGELSRQR